MDKIDKYTESINNMVGGKTFDHKLPQKIRSDTPYEKRQRELVDKYQGKWKNLYFDGLDKCYWGENLFDTQKLAQHHFDYYSVNDLDNWRFQGGVIVPKSDIVRAIPMPAGKS